MPGQASYNWFTGRVGEMLMRGGMKAALAHQAAVAEASGLMLQQAAMLSYKNAFTIMSITVVSPVAAAFLMRLPPKRGPKPPPEEMVAH